MLPSGSWDSRALGAPLAYRYEGALPTKMHPHWESWWCCLPLPVPDTLSGLSPVILPPTPPSSLRANSGEGESFAASVWKIWLWLRKEGKDGDF